MNSTEPRTFHEEARLVCLECLSPNRWLWSCEHATTDDGMPHDDYPFRGAGSRIVAPPSDPAWKEVPGPAEPERYGRPIPWVRWQLDTKDLHDRNSSAPSELMTPALAIACYKPEEIEFLRKNTVREGEDKSFLWDDCERYKVTPKRRYRAFSGEDHTDDDDADDAGANRADDGAIDDGWAARIDDGWPARVLAREWRQRERKERQRRPEPREHLFQRARAERIQREFRLALAGARTLQTNPLAPEPRDWKPGRQVGVHQADTLLARRHARQRVETAIERRIDVDIPATLAELRRQKEEARARMKELIPPGWWDSIPMAPPVRLKRSAARKAWLRANSRRRGGREAALEEGYSVEELDRWERISTCALRAPRTVNGKPPSRRRGVL